MAEGAKQILSFRSPRRRSPINTSRDSIEGSDDEIDSDWGMQVLEDAAGEMNTVGDYVRTIRLVSFFSPIT